MNFPYSYGVNYVKTVMEFIKFCEAHSTKEIMKVGFDEEYNRFAVIFANKETPKIISKPEEKKTGTLLEIPSHDSPKEESKGKNTHNSRANVPKWSEEEINVIKATPDHNEAWLNYQKRFPGMRNKNAIKQRWNLLHPNKKPKIKQPTEPKGGEPSNNNSITIMSGTVVRYVRGKGRFLRCTGMVKRSNTTSGEILVQFDKGLEWVDAKHCEIVPIPKVE